jgi:hypothetical protein
MLLQSEASYFSQAFLRLLLLTDQAEMELLVMAVSVLEA